MENKKFEAVSANSKNPDYQKIIARNIELYDHDGDIRSPFARDYTRILHSQAFRRLKHKTQVFFNIDNDHICTRMEHVLLVESVSYTIAKALGLNDELTKAIAFGHDLGHAPFGHEGEIVLSEISQKMLAKPFSHEKNGLRFVDKVELLEDTAGQKRNLDLTYAVRDGIISHCGEVDDVVFRPRTDFCDLETLENKKGFNPITWEGCIVKVADRIAYLGRDIEDAKTLDFLSEEDVKKLDLLASTIGHTSLNTTVITHDLIVDICNNSSPADGIVISERYAEFFKNLKDFNYEYIYTNKRLESYRRYAKIVIREIFDRLYSYVCEASDVVFNGKKIEKSSRVADDFFGWVENYCTDKSSNNAINAVLYGDLTDKYLYAQAIIDYISGMTDRYAVEAFNELISYK